MSDREEITLNLFIGKRTDGEFVFLSDAFQYGESGLKGLTGSGFHFHTEKEMEKDNENYFNDTENVEYLFCEYIKRSHDRDCTVEDWIAKVIDENPNGVAYDESYAYEHYVIVAMSYASEKDEEEYEYSDCVHSGRIFNEEYLDKKNYDRVIEENFDKLVELYKEYEGYQPSCARECLAGENFTS